MWEHLLAAIGCNTAKKCLIDRIWVWDDVSLCAHGLPKCVCTCNTPPDARGVELATMEGEEVLARSAFKHCGHGIFRGLVPSSLCTEVRDAARGLPSEDWQQIFNAKNQTQSGRQMAQAPPVGQGVVNEVFAFLQNTATAAN